MLSVDFELKNDQKVLTCLQHFGQFRIALNEKLLQRLNELYSNNYLRFQVFQRIEKGRKVRSFLFLKIANSLASDIDENDLLDICLSIEMSHAASILVDDILDGDDIRHGSHSSQSSLGTPFSALQAHFLCAEAINLLIDKNEILRLLIETYRKLTFGEMYDVMMVEPLNGWIRNGYSEKVYQKTSALFEYCLAAAALQARQSHLVNELQKLGVSLGKLYQLSNDFYDLSPNNLRKRHSNGDSWRITFSLPLAIYLRMHGDLNIRNFLDKKLISYDEWLELLNEIWSKEVRDFAASALRQAEDEAEECISNSSLPPQIKMQLSCLVRLIVKEDFWYHPYNVQ